MLCIPGGPLGPPIPPCSAYCRGALTNKLRLRKLPGQPARSVLATGPPLRAPSGNRLASSTTRLSRTRGGRAGELLEPASPPCRCPTHPHRESLLIRAGSVGRMPTSSPCRLGVQGLAAGLGEEFELLKAEELPVLLREHARKFELQVAHASVWRRRSAA